MTSPYSNLNWNFPFWPSLGSLLPRFHEPLSSPRSIVLLVVLGPVSRPPCLGLQEMKASPRVFPRAMVFTTCREVAREGSRGHGQCLGKLGAALALAPLPWLLPSSLDLLPSYLVLDVLLDYKMVNTRFNGIRPVDPVNDPTEESTTRGCGRGRDK
uniref:'chromo' domain containing protein n=1 Tax=Solanum tuberosum TaxID=4113 RepID=M1DWD7_SOLTU